MTLSLWRLGRSHSVVWLPLICGFDHTLLFLLQLLDRGIVRYQIIEAGVINECGWLVLKQLLTIVCLRVFRWNISRSTMGCFLLIKKSISFYRCIPLCRIANRFVGPLSLIVNFLEIFKNIALFFERIGFPPSWSWNQPFGCNSKVFTVLEILKSCRDYYTSWVVNALREKHWRAIFCWVFWSFPIYNKIDHSDEFLPSVTDCKQLHTTNNEITWLVWSSCTCFGHRYVGWRSAIRNWWLVPSPNLIERYFYLLIIIICDASLLINTADFWRNKFRVVALTADFEINIRRNLNF